MKVWPEISCWHHEDSVDADTVDQLRKDFENLFPYFRKATYVEGILAPGECLYLPVGWWHYIRSLTPSFSVSFWFN
jgi:lysine-specific demethylase 8